MVARTNRIVVDLEEWSEEVLKWVEKGIETTTELAYDESRRRIAVDTGDTRDSIESTYRGFNGTVLVGSPIAIYLEYGTGIVL